MISRNACVKILYDHGVTDDGHLHKHRPRFRTTKEVFERRVDRVDGKRVLDVGAQWRHQALLFARDGYQVRAVDLPQAIATASVARLALAHSGVAIETARRGRPSLETQGCRG
jgi:2-polyprenyl-3-methyl-5-hydroxy-6-metoxy-1,4-benzoquinol methylase